VVPVPRDSQPQRENCAMESFVRVFVLILVVLGCGNPIDPIAAFAGITGGVASALQIKAMLNQPKRRTNAKRKRNGKTQAKRRKESASIASAAFSPFREIPRPPGHKGESDACLGPCTGQACPTRRSDRTETC
jgi:hypothetical protein